MNKFVCSVFRVRFKGVLETPLCRPRILPDYSPAGKPTEKLPKRKGIHTGGGRCYPAETRKLHKCFSRIQKMAGHYLYHLQPSRWVKGRLLVRYL